MPHDQISNVDLALIRVLARIFFEHNQSDSIPIALLISTSYADELLRPSEYVSLRKIGEFPWTIYRSGKIVLGD